MRVPVNRYRLDEFMKRLGQRGRTNGIVYLCGGATALLLGFRDQTLDIDIKLDPEPGGVFEAIADLKDTLGVNVKLAAPDQFIPPLPGWRERSAPIGVWGKIEFRHYDFYAQALAKIERGHSLDLTDAADLVGRGLVDLAELERLFDAIRPQLIRYPAIEASDFERKLREFLDGIRNG